MRPVLFIEQQAGLPVETAAHVRAALTSVLEAGNDHDVIAADMAREIPA
ncbi:hypothetical protein [Frateuria aurantia]|nr:hypothetical protein [Frateuria aurantia]